ncbi:MAG: tRNA (adenosine(37)-N6)-threonylcarbamoyltransferase complex dimerization subunit type 1 TsaB [Clostridiales Family XIII bacterium]|nr:tRNA (adenosine(37)-N6)-threonylcarbamoyltransferase complex dimerization subunit type 1 TsaB [Clostridiales Family XIII bacterium]
MADILLLAIETTGPRASAALLDGAGHLSEKTADGEMNHLTGLVGMIGGLLAERGARMDDVTHVAASQGPGSFTGIRIGISTARALAQTKNLPAVGVPTLESFVYHLPACKGVVCPVFDARRSQVYSGAAYLDASAGQEPTALDAAAGPQILVAGNAWAPEDLLAALGEIPWAAHGGLSREIVFFGDGLSVYGDLIRAWQPVAAAQGVTITFAPEAERGQRASSVARLALHRVKEGRVSAFQDLTPVYMRQAEAQRKLDAGVQFVRPANLSGS